MTPIAGIACVFFYIWVCSFCRAPLHIKKDLNPLSKKRMQCMQIALIPPAKTLPCSFVTSNCMHCMHSAGYCLTPEY
jgi:hypothetical protein